jgi:hypothetical protein
MDKWVSFLKFDVHFGFVDMGQIFVGTNFFAELTALGGSSANRIRGNGTSWT